MRVLDRQGADGLDDPPALMARWVLEAAAALIEAAGKLFAGGKVEYLIVSGNQADGGRAAGG